MKTEEERGELIAPMELIGKAIAKLYTLFQKTDYSVYGSAVDELSDQLNKLKEHDNYLQDSNLP
jgi:hypothetical protein